MKRLLLAAVLWSAFLAAASDAHDLGRSDILISPSSDYIETGEYVISVGYLPSWKIDPEIRHFRPELYPGWDYSIFTLKDKESGVQKSTLVEIEGNFEPRFYGFDKEEYCGVDVLFVTVSRGTPRYGGALSRWITTYIFRADTFAMIEEFTGSALEVTRFDNRVKPEVPSSMDERYLVSCIPEGRGRKFSFGLIDRKALYGPDWCGPGGDRCEIP